MKIKIAWGIQSFFLCFVFNLAFAAVVFFLADRVLEALNEWMSPFARPGAPELSGDVQMGLAGMRSFVVQIRGYMMSVLAALASAFTLLMWFFLFLAGRRQIRSAANRAGAPPEPETGSRAPTTPGSPEEPREQSDEGEEAP